MNLVNNCCNTAESGDAIDNNVKILPKAGIGNNAPNAISSCKRPAYMPKKPEARRYRQQWYQ
jgi:hypothetical protein